MTRHHSCRVSPFGHPRIHARLTAPRGISQPPTSFIGSQCQGIHHAPLNTYNTKPKNESPTPKKGCRLTKLHIRHRKTHTTQRAACAHTTQKTKNYIELKNSEIAHQHTHNTQPPQEPSATCVLDARNHYPQIKHHTPPPKRGDNQSYPRFPTLGTKR